MAWTRAVCGRMKSDYSYSITIVYNNFPFPSQPTQSAEEELNRLSKRILEARSSRIGATLADLYDPLTMPADLLEAHKQIDAAVDKLYGYKGSNDDTERVAFVFGLYQSLTNLPVIPKKKTRKAK